MRRAPRALRTAAASWAGTATRPGPTKAAAAGRAAAGAARASTARPRQGGWPMPPRSPALPRAPHCLPVLPHVCRCALRRGRRPCPPPARPPSRSAPGRLRRRRSCRRPHRSVPASGWWVRLSFRAVGPPQFRGGGPASERTGCRAAREGPRQHSSAQRRVPRESSAQPRSGAAMVDYD